MTPWRRSVLCLGSRSCQRQSRRERPQSIFSRWTTSKNRHRFVTTRSSIAYHLLDSTSQVSMHDETVQRRGTVLHRQAVRPTVSLSSSRRSPNLFVRSSCLTLSTHSGMVSLLMRLVDVPQCAWHVECDAQPSGKPRAQATRQNASMGLVSRLE